MERLFNEGGRFKSLHGRAEIDEDIRQTVIATYYPDRLLDYLLYRAENYQEDDWEQAAVSAWIDCDLLNQLVKDEGENLFLTNIKRAGELKIPASPTLLINGEKMQGPIKQWALSRQLCLQEYNFQKCRDIPVCGHDFDCNAEGRVGVCLDPDTPKARCRFSDPVKVRLEIIKATDCAACDHNSFLKWAQEIFPGIEAVEIDSNSSEGKKLIEDYSIHALPAYFFDPNIQKTARYHVIKEQLNQKKDRFLLSNNQIKVSSLIDRPLQKESLAIFTEGFSFLGLMAVRKIINSSLPDSAAFTAHLLAQTLDQDNDTNPRVLNLVPGKDNELVLTPQQSKVVFQAPGGLKEIQEDMRQVCLAHHYPNLYLPYLKCIAGLSSKQIEEGKWQDCLKEINLDEKDLVPCTHGKEGVDLLLKEIDLADHLGIQKSPTYLINNKVLLKEAPPDFALYIYHQMNSQESKN